MSFLFQSVSFSDHWSLTSQWPVYECIIMIHCSWNTGEVTRGVITHLSCFITWYYTWTVFSLRVNLINSWCSTDSNLHINKSVSSWFHLWNQIFRFRLKTMLRLWLRPDWIDEMLNQRFSSWRIKWKGHVTAVFCFYFHFPLPYHNP